MKIGLVGNNQEIKDILKLFSNIAIKSIGIFSSENEKINIKKINIKYYFDFDKLLNNSDAIFFLSEEKSFFEFAKKTIQQSKHIFINNISNLTQETTKQLFKLSAEAKTNIQIRQ
ncbi:MAG: hypothetical protein U9R54_00775, partial [Bacteroidota bacterium]|nr:hypothetical protein [Bacteroidota bacterium]